ncbi:hypothetical protein GCM10023200_03020 [Actinomycetospora chlora]|uniref:Uncharacterized protein n=1 Tax=Actinomycetospora chlora TaxID=663608 RepID=A0ABP9A683_9PSEU
MSIAFGVATLIALAVWAVWPSRVAMWVAVVLRAVSALFAVPAFLDAPTVAFQAVLVVVVVATIVGIVLVRGALGPSRTTAGV